MRRLAALVLFLFPCVVFADINISSGSKYSPVRGVAWGSSFNVTYLLTPVSPEVGVCFAIVNNNPSSSHTFTAQVFQSADSGVLDYSNNTGRFSSVTVSSLPASVGAGATVAGFSGTTSAAQIAFKFTASSAAGGSPDTADLFFVQTSSNSCGAALSTAQVQGAVAVSTSLTGVNPLAIGGRAVGGTNQYYSVGLTGDGGGFNYQTMPIGGLAGTSMGIGNIGGQFIFPAGSPAGPLAVAPFGQRTPVGSLTNFFMSEGTGSGGTNGNPPGLFIVNAGYVKVSSTAGLTTSGQSVALWAGIGSGNPVLQSCYITIQGTNTAGTAPTLDVFLQTSNDGTTWTDRVHFNQITTTASNQYVGLANTAGLPVTVVTDRTLAAGTKVDGPIGYFGRFIVNISGTAPSYNLSYGVSCT
jgi:hypothetical protein